ncbi:MULTISPECIES: porin family protein [Mesonia]|uniref:Uncharacterized protein n=1 Tax=Mesonia oceanica TaxID=2687242 RepID=A0AC61Y3X8_9FLAO|nr:MULTISPECIES: porin [Mesonia]MAN28262.1 hypothetical protein [Mesonia sp.]MAQ41481.1 hypothetical protein [Mesonia sp.]VVU99018.1 hypothetical protein FVB9532_00268 [Mesonia oceanica]|tara:strand:+ start:14986 stop:16209 length:1224 start_codon:yes stop_codon:yes gene_type:complete
MKTTITYLLFFFTIGIMAQENDSIINSNTADFELGKGLQFNFENNNYQFKIGGFIQPSYSYQKTEGIDGDSQFNAKRTYFNIGGKALKEKVSFFIQTNFSLSDPLLDAWVAYHPTENIHLTVGQQRTFTNNREMTFDEDKFQFTTRSLLSTELSNTGREFGVFVDGEFLLGSVGLHPQIAVTSGDGRNSFGADSRDTDRGGLKYGGRLDVYPLGYFKKGNAKLTADLLHEEHLKMVIGGAASYNDGTSNAVGEGHNDFVIYEENGKPQLPDYRKLYADVLLKYQGFSFLAEYANASATGLEETFVNEAGTVALQPQQISSYLALGDAYNLQAGYVTLSGLAFDLRYTSISPEFEDYAGSVLTDKKAYTFGFTKYFKGNDLKVQTAFSSIEQNEVNTFRAELVLQVVF